ncbi:SusC/RagA family TonB-linked outer membrane protein [Sinomicrobium oceani]|uniref:SusC/RagA family TonB-linked outer membrane protein n=1 Tax=Sinomicrobium oceani TaxID=1150368 RepID=UPI00227C72AC|nr:SusC/RagA family TonB-linked outer membrane protein [Sinomicrobium oceani]
MKNDLYIGKDMWRYALFTGMLLVFLPVFASVSPPIFSLQHEINGTVTDIDGLPLPGVNIIIKGTQQGTISDSDGRYVIAAGEKDVLVFSYIGFKTLERSVNGHTILNVQLEEDITALEGIEVNAGYYTVKEREQTGNIAKVTSEEIELQPIVSPLEALQGRMAGVEIVQDNGIPGNAPVIRIRGQNSLRDDGNYPLYIIDGMPINSTPIDGGNNFYMGGMDPLSTLNVSNIESIEVLKDADATAIYGSRGANGVVLITTKKGNFERKTAIEARWYSGFGKVSRKEDLLNTEQYLTLRRAALENDGREPDESSDYDLLVWDQNRYTDWQEVLFGGTSQITNINIAASGGSKTTSFRLGGSYHKEGIVFPGDNDYHKITAGLNLNHTSENEKLNINFSVNYGIDQSDVPAYDNNSFIGMALTLPPNAPELYNEDGTLHWKEWEYSQWNNPLAAILNRTSSDEGHNIVANLGLSYQLFQGLLFKANMGYTNLSRDYKALFSKNEYRPEIRDSQNHSSRERHATRKSWIIEPQLAYNTPIGEGTLDGLIGITFQQNDSKNLIVTGEGFVSEALIGDLSAAESVNVINNQVIQYKYNALFARLSYNWRKKYFINLTGRRDGSSRFGPNKRFSNFWAVGGAWIFSEEPFMKKHFPFLSYGKFRGSYGTTGSDQIGDYEYLDAYEATVGPNGLYPTGLTNPDYSWEENKKLEAAIQLGFLQDRITLGVSWYRNRSSNQLVGFPLPSITGFSTVQANLPATVQNTGWEFEMSTLNINSNDFKWQTFVNLSIPNNKLVRFPNMDQTIYANTYRVGHPLNIQLLYPYDGIDPDTGLYRVVDVNEDERYDYEDRIIIKETGRKYFGGMTNNFSYKGFALSFLWEFVSQDARERRTGLPGYKAQQTAHLFDQWNYGKNDHVQIISESSAANTTYSRAYSSERFFTNASFLRLRTLSLSYELPTKPLQEIGLNRCSLFLQGQNLFTITGYNSLNVENPGQPTIPVLRTITFGIQIHL